MLRPERTYERRVVPVRGKRGIYMSTRYVRAGGEDISQAPEFQQISEYIEKGAWQKLRRMLRDEEANIQAIFESVAAVGDLDTDKGNALAVQLSLGLGDRLKAVAGRAGRDVINEWQDALDEDELVVESGIDAVVTAWHLFDLGLLGPLVHSGEVSLDVIDEGYGGVYMLVSLLEGRRLCGILRRRAVSLFNRSPVERIKAIKQLLAREFSSEGSGGG